MYEHQSYIGMKMQVRNDKARKYLMDMRKKHPVPFTQKFPNVDPLALRLLQRLLAFDPKDRPTAEEVLPFSFASCYVENSLYNIDFSFTILESWNFVL